MSPGDSVTQFPACKTLQLYVRK